MKLGVISDIHGNLEALETVLKRLGREKVEEIICLGDIVGYGANPNECCSLIRKECTTVTLGNHDEWAVRQPDRGLVNRNVWQSILWTAERVEPQYKEYLSTLPLIVHRGDLVFAHSAPAHPHRWDYITGAASAAPYFHYIAGKTCFVGHSHLPGVYESASGADSAPARIVNVGSVGQPRDGNAAACLCIYDSAAQPQIRFVRLAYDFPAAADKILRSGLPPFFAARLGKGF